MLSGLEPTKGIEPSFFLALTSQDALSLSYNGLSATRKNRTRDLVNARVTPLHQHLLPRMA